MKGARLVAVAFVAASLLIEEVSPQSATVTVNNQALFGLGAVLFASGIAYHLGRQNGINQYRGGNRYNNNPFPFFGRRRRRQAHEDTAKSPYNELDPLVGQLFQMALERDTTGCSLQLSCAIGKLPPAELTGHAKELYGVLSLTPEIAKEGGKTPWSGMNAHKTALNFGRDGGACHQLSPLCPESSKQLIAIFQRLRVFDTSRK